MKSFRISLIFISIFAFFYTTPTFAEKKTIYLKNGKILRGEVLQQNATSLTVKIDSGETIQLNKTEINMVSFGDATKEKKAEVEPNKKETNSVEIPSPAIVSEKPVLNFRIDQLNRKDLELYLGIGAGKYTPDTQEFLARVQNKFGLLSSIPPTQIDKPTHKPSVSETFGGIYTWKRWSGGIHGSYFQNRSTYHAATYSETGMSTTEGSFPEKQSSLKGDFSFLAFTNDRFDLRPSLGYQYFWGRTQDPNGSTNYFIATGLYLYANSAVEFQETLKGYTIGLKATIRMGDRWENRLEYHNLTLSGNQNGSTVSTLVPVNLSQFAIIKLSETAGWRADGFHFLYRLVYRITPTLSIYGGFQYYEWKYNLDNFNLINYSSKDGFLGIDPTYAFQQEKLLEAIAKSSTSNSKSSIIEFGIMKRLEFR
ncbi:LA_0442/LA_0875 N-terminal domain-containing protein [Leptospira sarikeiensis]|uniref:Uncharacterized protein n=1 Tax=Leptospira sarikeiensis TaxID=2484943 RepID=A0A4R9KC94_9LEPT|nr:hypothetical protein [Leptospira sarikeiensis]TGL63706.1 hypothetical protein EHQ64_07095 [Leptospira sarikeiensis]